MVGLSQSAPQIRQQGVVSQVIGQLQPAIQRIVASTLGGGRQTAGFGQGATGAVRTSSFGQGATGFSQGSRFGQGSTGTASLSASQLTSNVVTSLQPAIAAAVAQALRSSQSRPSTSVSALTPQEEVRINAQRVVFNHFYFSLPMPSMPLNTKLVMTTHRPILHRKSPGMVKMCKGHTTMLTQLELLLLSPTRQDLRGTLRIERCRKEQCRSRRETFLNLGLDLLLESLHHHLHHLVLHHLVPHHLGPACPSQI